MKKISILYLFSALLALIIIACNTKDIVLVTDVELDFSQNATDNGFVNDLLPTTIIITPEAFLPEFNYFFKYEVLEGQGIFLNAKEEEFPAGETILLTKEEEDTNFTLPLNYKGLTAGNHQVKVTASDNFEKSFDVILKYTIKNIPVIWTATTTINKVTLGNTVPAIITLQNNINTIPEVTFKRNYRFTEGSGELLDNEDNVITLNKPTDITPGSSQITIIPDALGTTTVVFDLEDSNGQQVSDLITIEVVEEIINQAPIAIDDNITTSSNSSVTINPLQNDSDPDGDQLNITKISDPLNGIATLLGNIITYTPNNLFIGNDTFNYTINDGNEHEVTATITINITNTPNEAPSAKDDTTTANAETTKIIDVLENDTDPENDTLTIITVSNPLNGTVVITNGKISYTPKAGFTGTDNFTYTINDGKVGNDATAKVTVTVSEIANAKPVAIDDTRNATEGIAMDIAVLANDSDPDNDTITVTAVQSPLNGTATINTDGTIKYTPNAPYVGNDSFDYTISDGNLTATATVTVTVSATPNTKPVAIDDTKNATEGIAVDIAVLANDSDPDSDTITVISVQSPLNGTATINTDGTIKYTSNAPYVGNDAFEYIISDGNLTAIATVTVTVSATPNTKPIAVISTNTTSGIAPIVIEYTGSGSSDLDANALTYSWDFGDPSSSNNQSTQPNPGHSYNTAGTYTAKLIVSDGNLTDEATVVITVSANQLPTAVITQTLSTNDGAPDTINFTGEDSNDNDGTIVEYQWNFGDPGSGANNTSISNTLSEASHTYANAGDYTVTLIIKDDKGGTDSTSLAININPTIAPDFNFTISPVEQGSKVIDFYIEPNLPASSAGITYQMEFREVGGNTLNGFFYNGTIYVPTVKFNAPTGVFSGTYQGDGGSNRETELSFTVTPSIGNPKTRTITLILCGGSTGITCP